MGSMGLLGVTGGYKRLQGVTKGYRGLQGVPIHNYENRYLKLF